MSKFNPSKKGVIVLFGVAVLAAVIVFALLARQEEKQEAAYIFDKTHPVSFQDIADARGAIETDLEKAASSAASPGVLEKSDLEKYFAGEFVVTPYTLQYFIHLTSLFKDAASLEEALELAREFIFSQMPQDQAQKVFALYKNYLETELALAETQRDWGVPQTIDDVIDLLRQIQDFRRERLGRAVADALFGPDIKVREYSLRRGAIVRDDELYGAQKQALIAGLSQDMWGQDAGLVESYHTPYNRYQEKLEMYKRDLAEMASPEAAQSLIREFREEFFTPEQVLALDEVDFQIAQEEKALAGFEQARQQILEDTELSDEEKQSRVSQLIDSTFGEEAQAFLRREAMEEGRRQMIEQHGRQTPAQ
ncbi:MAG: lipase secretion chaperone [Desulfatibacillaceae bacterium]|nr:lipase secretion chaperone [Desulfatibacillaceae bacterium]